MCASGAASRTRVRPHVARARNAGSPTAGRPRRRRKRGRPAPCATPSSTAAGRRPAPPALGTAATRSSARGRRVPRAQPVQLRAGLAARLLEVGEALCRQQGGARHAALEQRIGAHGHPVHEALDVAGVRPPALERPPRWPASPSDWSSGVVGDLPVTTRSPPTRTASVKVPPTSTPRITAPRQREPRRAGRQAVAGTARTCAAPDGVAASSIGLKPARSRSGRSARRARSLGGRRSPSHDGQPRGRAGLAGASAAPGSSATGCAPARRKSSRISAGGPACITSQIDPSRPGLSPGRSGRSSGLIE